MRSGIGSRQGRSARSHRVGTEQLVAFKFDVDQHIIAKSKVRAELVQDEPEQLATATATAVFGRFLGLDGPSSQKVWRQSVGKASIVSKGVKRGQEGSKGVKRGQKGSKGVKRG